MGGQFQLVWRFFDFASGAILFAASGLFLANFLVASYFASKIGTDLNDLLFYAVYPAILSGIVFFLSAITLPRKLFVLIGYYTGLERMAKFDLAWRDKLPGPKWFYMMGPLGQLSDAQLLLGKTEEAEKNYYQVAEYSKISGLWASFLVGPSLENYAERLASTGRLLDYADWKGRFRGATISRRIIIVLWLALTVLAGQMALRYTVQNIPNIASSLSYLGRYELADSVLSSGLRMVMKFSPGSRADINAFRIKMAQNDVRWGRLAEAEQEYRAVLPLDDILAGKLDAELGDQVGALSILQELAVLDLRRGRMQEARTIMEKLLKLNPSPGLLLPMADLLVEEGKPDEAEKTLHKAEEKIEKVADVDAKTQLQVAAKIRKGRIKLLAKDGAAAQSEFSGALSQVEQSKGKLNDFKLAALLGLMEASHWRADPQKETDARVAVLDEINRIDKEVVALKASVGCYQVAESLIRCGRFADADQILLVGMDLIDSATSDTNPALASYYVRRGEIAFAQGNVDAAAKYCEKALSLINKRSLSSEHPAVLDLTALMGKDALKLKMDDEAASFFGETVRIVEKNGLQRFDAKIADALNLYKELLLKHGNKDRADEVDALLARTKVRQSGYN